MPKARKTPDPKHLLLSLQRDNYTASSRTQIQEFPAGSPNSCTNSKSKKCSDPIELLSRRRDKNGSHFLSKELVTSAHMLREDYEVSRLASLLGREFETGLSPSFPGTNHKADYLFDSPHDRFQQAMLYLGPILSDVARACCCHLQGMEDIEQRFGWSSRSGKIVLRIALIHLAEFYSGSNRYDYILRLARSRGCVDKLKDQKLKLAGEKALV